MHLFNTEKERLLKGMILCTNYERSDSDIHFNDVRVTYKWYGCCRVMIVLIENLDYHCACGGKLFLFTLVLCLH